MIDEKALELIPGQMNIGYCTIIFYCMTQQILMHYGPSPYCANSLLLEGFRHIFV